MTGPSFGNTSDLPICVQFPQGCKELDTTKATQHAHVRQVRHVSKCPSSPPRPKPPHLCTSLVLCLACPLPSSSPDFSHTVDAPSPSISYLSIFLLCCAYCPESRTRSCSLFVCLYVFIYMTVSAPGRQRSKLLCLQCLVSFLAHRRICK